MVTFVTRSGDRPRGMNDPDRARARSGEASRTASAFVSSYERSVPASEVREEPKVREIMTRDVQSCTADQTLLQAGIAMNRGDCRFLPVVDDRGRPIAVITDGDICEIGTTDHRRLREIPVSEAMSSEVFTCRPEDGIREVLDTMRRQRIRHLPVVNAEGSLVGVVSLTDVILSIEEGDQERAKLLRPVVAKVLRVVSQKEHETRIVSCHAFRED